jgi:hypothetical protein
MLRSILSFLVALPLAIFAVPWCAMLLAQVWSARVTADAPWPDQPWAVAGGMVLGLALAWWKTPNWFIHTTIHELCHALACWTLWVRVRGFAASDGQGGKVEYDRCDPIRDTLIAVAPYTLPLMLGVMLLVHRLVPDEQPWPDIATGLVGLAIIDHLHGLYHNVRLNFWGGETDFAKAGRPLMLVLIVLSLLLTAATVVRELYAI